MAHRGDVKAYPENTVEAIVAAGNAGVHLIEFDVQFTRDAVPVVLHDPDLQRTAGLAQSIFKTDRSALSDILLSPSGDQVDAGQVIRIPTLESVLGLLGEHPEWRFFIEIKREAIEHFGPGFVVELLLPLIYDYLSQIVIISFDYDFLIELCRRSDAELGWVLSAYNDEAYAKALALDPEYLLVNRRRLPALNIPLWEGAWQWVSYEVTSTKVARELFSRGIDIVSSMKEPWLLSALDSDV